MFLIAHNKRSFQSCFHLCEIFYSHKILWYLFQQYYCISLLLYNLLYHQKIYTSLHHSRMSNQNKMKLLDIWIHHFLHHNIDCVFACISKCLNYIYWVYPSNMGILKSNITIMCRLGTLFDEIKSSNYLQIAIGFGLQTL